MAKELLQQWDPLAALEAEYAACLALSTRSDGAKVNHEAQDQDHHHEDEEQEQREARETNGYVKFVDFDDQEEEEDDDDDKDGEPYALLLSSPVAGSSDEENDAQCDEAQRRPEEAVRLVRDDDDNDDNDMEEEQAKDYIKKKSAGSALPFTMQPERKQQVMKSMAQLQLQPPPWAQAMNLSDDQLNAWVWQHLSSRDAAHAQDTSALTEQLKTLQRVETTQLASPPP